MYKYEDLKPTIFSEEGFVRFLKIRDETNRILSISGAITMGAAISACTGDSWENMACVDRMVEIGEIKEIPTNGAGQYRIFAEVSR